MRTRTSRSLTLLVIALFVLASAPVWAQDAAAVVEQRVEALRQQLRDVTDKQAQLQTRIEELNESLKPENVERSVAGIGTTDASSLRDQRREQLERQKAVVEEQLRSLDVSRTRLESAIATAEAEAVRLRASALAPNNSTPRDNAATNTAPAASTAPAKQTGKRNAKRRKRARARRRAPSR